MSDESAKLIAEAVADFGLVPTDHAPLIVELSSRLKTTLADLAKMTEERDELQTAIDFQSGDLIAWRQRAEAAESALARMKAQGTFAEGVEAAAKYHDERNVLFQSEADKRAAEHATSLSALDFEIEAQRERAHATNIRALTPPKPAEEPQS